MMYLSYMCICAFISHELKTNSTIRIIVDNLPPPPHFSGPDRPRRPPPPLLLPPDQRLLRRLRQRRAAVHHLQLEDRGGLAVVSDTPRLAHEKNV